MNERILELAIEARTYAESKPDRYQVAYDKKFAELIVNDILNIVAISGEQCDCSTLFRNISEHFGVTQ